MHIFCLIFRGLSKPRKAKLGEKKTRRKKTRTITIETLKNAKIPVNKARNAREIAPSALKGIKIPRITPIQMWWIFLPI